MDLIGSNLSVSTIEGIVPLLMILYITKLWLFSLWKRSYTNGQFIAYHHYRFIIIVFHTSHIGTGETIRKANTPSTS